MASHAIFALSAGTDELDIALRAGTELVAKGHDVWLYGRPETGSAALVEGIPFHEVDAEDVATNLEAIAEELDSILVTDFLTTFGMLVSKKPALERVRKLDKLLVLDPWNIGEGGRVLDTFSGSQALPKTTLLTSKRLVPSFHDAGDRTFRIYPERPAGDGQARRASARRALGVSKDERVLLLATSALQLEDSHREATTKQLVRRVLRSIVDRLATIEGVRVVHVGPGPLPWTEPLGDRYTWLVPPDAAHLHNRFAAADAVLTLDAMSASLAWAACWTIPAMVLVNEIEVKSSTAKVSTQFAMTKATKEWLADSTPLPRFRHCPLGLFETLATPDPPYVPLQLLDETGFREVTRALLFDEGERERAVRDSASCMEASKDLPTAGELWEKLASA